MNAFKLLIVSATVLVCYAGCAKVVTLTGGEKDVTPPAILRSIPKNECLGYLGNSIVLEFDEFIQLKNMNSELIISPPLPEFPDIKLKGKKLTIAWNETLEEQTTYLFQFGNGIVDLNESNPLDSNVFVFSTGHYLDSLELKGSVASAENHMPENGVWVMLYRGTEDSLPLTTLPDYFARTDKEGKFHFRYLRSGDYKIFALKPENGGYTYDLPQERIAFLTERVVPASMDTSSVTDSTLQATALQLLTFVQEDSTQYIKKFIQLGNKGLAFGYNRPVDSLKVRNMTTTRRVDTNWTAIWNTERDSVVFWFPELYAYDSLRLELDCGDRMDTLFFRKPGLIKRGGKSGPDPNAFILSMDGGDRQSHFDSLVIRSAVPLMSHIRSDRYLFIEENDTLDIGLTFKLNLTSLVIPYHWKENTKYTLILADSFVCDRYDRCCDSTFFSFQTTRQEDFGQLTIHHQLPEVGHPYVWQLLNSSSIAVDERAVNAVGTVRYLHLPSGSYRIKLIQDENGNGKWDTGHYPSGRQPEHVLYFDQKIEIRSNWESEFDWKLQP